jgi:NADH:ubiquinone oxidoreductase subunit 4 (subunit M)
MTVLIFTGMLGGWFVHQANQAYDRMRTCRYREFKRLSRRAEAFSAGYRIIGIALVAMPGGAPIGTLVLSYAAFRRLTAH